MQGDVVKPHNMEDEIDKYWPARHLIKYYEGVIKDCEDKIARAKMKIEDAKKSCEKGEL